MRILVIGSGGREHALTWKLWQSPHVDQIFCAPGNAGTGEIAENVAIPASGLTALVRFAKENRVDLTVVGPDDPLAAGIVDLFTSEKLRAFGPDKSAARIESSKIFAKELMRTQKIPTAEARTFSNSSEALHYCERLRFPIVIKADGLALGKGVVIAADAVTARSTIDDMMNQARFGDAGRRIIIEEFLHGTECSLHALVDGKNYLLLESSRDHKRALDGDQGPNTGGMGAFSPANNWNTKLQLRFDAEIMKPLLRGLIEEGVTFRGLLYPGLIMTSDGPRVLEFNCRFGDPETQALLPRMKSDLLPLLEATIDGKNYLLLESSRDHKRALDGDRGPNTGGMGAFSPANNWNTRLQLRFDTEIMNPLLRGLIEEGVTFRGLLYPGLIITSDGTRVLEFNCRFGDPETQVLLPRMKSDLLPLLEATIDGKIERCAIEWDTRSAVTVVLASGGYPGKYESGKSISGLDQAAKLKDVQVFHAGTKREGSEVKTAGGRVLAVTALGSSLEAARASAYEAVSRIHFENCHYRRDIALNAVAANMTELL